MPVLVDWFLHVNRGGIRAVGTPKESPYHSWLPICLTLLIRNTISVSIFASMSKEGDKCNCSWPECDWLSEQIEKHAPEGHVWKGNRHRWKETRLSKRTMFERMLFLAAMCKHVPGIEESFKNSGRGSNRKEIVLARHHFPTVVYDFLGTRRITTLVKEGQMDFLVERDASMRLSEECNRVRRLASLLKSKVLQPGQLLDAFAARENEFIGSKGKLFICAPVVTYREVIDTLNVFKRKRKERLVQEQLSPFPPLPVGGSSLLLLGIAAELPDAIIEQSPAMVPSLEDCVAKIKSEVKTMGIDNVCNSKNFITSIRLLRFVYCNNTAIPLVTGDGSTSHRYLHPCKDDDANNKSCTNYRIVTEIFNQGLYCCPCQLKIDKQTRKRTKET